ncbi:hypothetical protein FRC00_011781 [Tulasnella sp. 408]|nr:hypothetical protein FRC00_011781 [Tulasnella sp. 408]
MSLAPFSRPALVFDGSDPSIPFGVFFLQLANGLTGSLGPLEVVPAHLYGDALRFYESLSIFCQQSAANLISAMEYRFSDDYKAQILSSLGLKGEEGKLSFLTRKRSSIFAGLRDKLHVDIRPFRSKTPPPPQTFALLDITVHSFFIEQFPSRHHQGPGNLIVQIDLNDRKAVEEARYKELVSVHKYRTIEYEISKLLVEPVHGLTSQFKAIALDSCTPSDPGPPT